MPTLSYTLTGDASGLGSAFADAQRSLASFNAQMAQSGSMSMGTGISSAQASQMSAIASQSRQMSVTISAAMNQASQGASGFGARLGSTIKTLGEYGGAIRGIAEGASTIKKVVTNFSEIQKTVTAARTGIARFGSTLGQALNTTRGRVLIASIAGVGAAALTAAAALRTMRAAAGVASDAVSGIARVARTAGAAVSNSLGSALRGIGGLLPSPLFALAGGAGAAALAFAGLKRSIEAAAQMEGFETGFKVLLGSTTAAKDRMQELAKFAADTPFELPEVAAASRTLQGLTKGALATGAGLTMVGDVASGTQQPFEELAVTIGRVYNGLKSGSNTIGAEMNRLVELGAVSQETKLKLEGMLNSGKKGDAMWQMVAAEMGKFTGMMKAQSMTWDGLMSTLRDNIGALFREFGRPIVSALKPMLTQGVSLVDSLSAKTRQWGESIAVGINMMRVAWSSGTLGSLVGLSLKVAFSDAVDFLREQLSGLFNKMQGSGKGMFAGLGMVLEGFADQITASITKGIILALGNIKILGKNLIPVRTGADAYGRAYKSGEEGKQKVDSGLTMLANLGGISAQVAGAITAFGSKTEEARTQLDALSESVRAIMRAMDLSTKIGDMVAKIFGDTLAGKKEFTGADPKDLFALILQAIGNAMMNPPQENAQAKQKQSKYHDQPVLADRLAKIGLFIGGAGGPQAHKAAQDTAKNTGLMAKLTADLVSDIKNLKPVQIGLFTPSS